MRSPHYPTTVIRIRTMLYLLVQSVREMLQVVCKSTYNYLTSVARLLSGWYRLAIFPRLSPIIFFHLPVCKWSRDLVVKCHLNLNAINWQYVVTQLFTNFDSNVNIISFILSTCTWLQFNCSLTNTISWWAWLTRLNTE